jgi:hypothetical protein
VNTTSSGGGTTQGATGQAAPGAVNPSMSGPAPGGMLSSGAGGLPILTPGYLQSHRVGIPGQKDVIWNPIYDSAIYPSTGIAGQALSFFTTQQGAGTSVSPGAYFNGTGKTQYDTNLQAPNAFTLGLEFYCIGSETDIFPGQASAGWPVAGSGYLPGSTGTALVATEFLNDVWVLASIGFKSLRIGTDRYYIQDGPLMKFPPRARLAVAAALASSITTAVVGAVYAVPSGAPYVIVPIYFQTNQLFTLTLTFAGAVILPSGFPALIRERLNGYLVRQAT